MAKKRKYKNIAGISLLRRHAYLFFLFLLAIISVAALFFLNHISGSDSDHVVDTNRESSTKISLNLSKDFDIVLEGGLINSLGKYSSYLSDLDVKITNFNSENIVIIFVKPKPEILNKKSLTSISVFLLHSAYIGLTESKRINMSITGVDKLEVMVIDPDSRPIAKFVANPEIFRKLNNKEITESIMLKHIEVIWNQDIPE